MQATPDRTFQPIINEIECFRWEALSQDELMLTACAYYYFSVQFRESLTLACEMHPTDPRLQSLREGECDTDNLSPFEGIAAPGERMNHDEFMHRVMALTTIDARQAARLNEIGQRYLTISRQLPKQVRATSISTYEDGGLETVFRAILTAPDWSHPALKAFHHFLAEHVRFDSDTENGHGALSRHLRPANGVHLMWAAFRDLLIDSVPQLVRAEEKLCA